MSTNKQVKPLLQVRDVCVHFPIPASRDWPWQPIPKVKAVDGVSFDLMPGETLGVVGESGCGKSTLARALIGLVKATSGDIIWEGKNLAGMDDKGFHDVRRDMQMIFQD
ncbi:ATP-binding cassette domain-containing protein, partial [Sansalvadorimonas verongulae]|uniref:ATP-binding cassette domain-containing protein n=1 Tax=Sansalvadorimonas verongulae TaxID=2172824 RepID=UPI002E35FE04